MQTKTPRFYIRELFLQASTVGGYTCNDIEAREFDWPIRVAGTACGLAVRMATWPVVVLDELNMPNETKMLQAWLEVHAIGSFSARCDEHREP